jgi:signal transduction histidine kinase
LTRLRRINQRLVEANRRLEGLDLAKSRFLRISAHQLRSPLAAVHTMLSAIQEAGGLNHQQYEIVRKIQTKSEDAMTLVDEMMLLSTISESAAEVRQVHPCDVDAAVRAEVEAFSPVAGAKRLTLCIDAQSGAAVIAWDDALETVLEHLISNAVKYTPSGGSIGIATRRCDAGVELKVTDTGIGIPPEQKDRLFHEFFRATNARQVAGGTGMGLAIVQAIVGRLDGTILIDSTQDKGTAVTVVLPITESPAAQVADGAEDAETPKTSESGADAGEHKGENDDRLEMPMTQGRLKPAK